MRMILALVLLCLPSAADAQSVKERLIGTWQLVSFDNTAPDGTKRAILGANPKGIAVFDAGGRYVVLSIKAGRPKWRSRNRLEASDEEIKSAGLGIITLFGTWSYNDTDSTITRTIEGSFIPNNEGSEFKSGVKLDADRLIITDANASVGGKVEASYKRAK